MSRRLLTIPRLILPVPRANVSLIHRANLYQLSTPLPTPAAGTFYDFSSMGPDYQMLQAAHTYIKRAQTHVTPPALNSCPLEEEEARLLLSLFLTRRFSIDIRPEHLTLTPDTDKDACDVTSLLFSHDLETLSQYPTDVKATTGSFAPLLGSGFGFAWHHSACGPPVSQPVSSYISAITARLLAAGDVDILTDRARHAYRKRVEVARNILDFSLPKSVGVTAPDAGALLVVTFPSQCDIGEFVEMAASKFGISFAAHITADFERDGSVSLNISSMTAEETEEAVSLFARAVQEFLGIVPMV